MLRFGPRRIRDRCSRRSQHERTTVKRSRHAVCIALSDSRRWTRWSIDRS
jgi:hypothetical protein